jgi:hypothetical protein
MAETWHGHLFVEDVALSAPQRLIVWDVLRAMAVSDAADPQPARRLHHRLSLDGSLINLEANFYQDDLSVAAFVQRLADAAGVDPSIVSTERINPDPQVDEHVFPTWNFIVGGTVRMRVALCARLQDGIEASRAAALAYINANIEKWETEE